MLGVVEAPINLGYFRGGIQWSDNDIRATSRLINIIWTTIAGLGYTRPGKH
jgi:hypothetical protein